MLCEVVADFARLNRRPGFEGESIPLGTDQTRPELGAFADGQRVLLIEPGNLKAEGTIAIRVVDGVRYYYGVIVGPVLDDAA
jgi:hypothetical protein